MGIVTRYLRKGVRQSMGRECWLGKDGEGDDGHGGEGSRGGNVIGHTASGKPVYGPGNYRYHGSVNGAKARTSDRKKVDALMAAHPTFTAQDHMDASRIHTERERTHPGEGGVHTSHGYSHPRAYIASQGHALAAARGGVVR